VVYAINIKENNFNVKFVLKKFVVVVCLNFSHQDIIMDQTKNNVHIAENKMRINFNMI